MTQSAKKPVIAIITPSLGLGGAEQWIRLLVTYCKEFEWVVGVISNDPRHDIIVNAVVENAAEVHGPANLHERAVAHNTVNDIVAATIKRAAAIIVWGGGPYWPLDTMAPIIFVGHGTCQWTAAATKQAEKGGGSHFVGVSDNVADVMRSVVPTVSVIMNGVDETRLKVLANRKTVHDEWRFGTYAHARYVGYLGRLGNEKNIDSVIYALASLPFHYYLVFIGCTGWKADPILQLARTVLRERLIEVQASDNIGTSLNAVDCIVQVSPREGHSLAICEAMLARVPIISNLTGALPQLEKMAGRELVERVPDEPLTNEIAAAIRRVCQSPPTDRIEAAEKFAKQHLTAAAMCRKWTTYLQNILATWEYKPRMLNNNPPKPVVSPVDEAWFKAMPKDDSQTQFVRAHATEWRAHVLPKVEKKHGKLRWLELGSLEGWSAKWVADHVLKPGDKLTCVDIWPKPDIEAKFDIKLAGRAEKCKIKSTDFLTQAIAGKRQFDVVYIDADHEAKSVLNDFVLSWYLVPVGGIIILDDYPLQFKAPSKSLPPATAIDSIMEIYGSRTRVLYKGWQVILEKTWDG